MDTASLQFVLFGLIAAALSNLSRSRAWRSMVILLASLIFLAILAKSAVVLIPLAAFLLFGYGVLAMRERGWFRNWFGSAAWSIPAVIFAYVWLKKYTFLPERFFLHFPYFTLGLSYIFFRVLHLLIEASEEAGAEEKQHIGFGAYLLYTLNFTTLVSGPIQRYDEFARDQFAVQPLPLGPSVIGLQLERIIRGFFKVNVLAMLLHRMQENGLEQLMQPVSIEHKLYAATQLTIAYPFFLYANFSGYIDIVIALARLMRIRLPENFDRPFSASSFLDFWNRWHITLSMWLKTYVYNPLLMALMRRISSISLQPFLGVMCFFVTFFLIGVWHGRTSEYIVFGILQGGGVAINKLWQLWLTRILGRKAYKDLAKNAIYIAFGRGLTFGWFAFTMFWFWANWKQIGTIFSSISVVSWLVVWLAIWFGATAVLAMWEQLRAMVLTLRTPEGPAFTSRYALMVYATAMGVIALVITVVLNQPAPAIVYKAF
ncbi:MBOAT family O-acyltransferase [Acidicapsa acidisoli]|uniref:MBOAT family O-acyltransferase n=1 Tax=Acidicapsa acidisoli TaxID=1615681 RepID=UPI0021E0C956|nr:MBOAT family O-acyltransferase [Acidicapsa acidisoli]